MEEIGRIRLNGRVRKDKIGFRIQER